LEDLHYEINELDDLALLRLGVLKLAVGVLLGMNFSELEVVVLFEQLVDVSVVVDLLGRLHRVVGLRLVVRLQEVLEALEVEPLLLMVEEK
jgi:hypothetical protein